MAREVLRRPNSIYGYLAKYISANPDPTNISAMINYFLVHFYLRLNGFIYCKLNSINPTAMLSAKLQNDIIHYMVDANDSSSPAAIQEVEEDKLRLLMKINSLK